MASATAKPDKNKRLVEFLKEQQEPFTLEVYLLERGYSPQRWTNKKSKSKQDSSSSFKTSSIKKRKSLFPFSKVLNVIHNKLAFHKESIITTTTTTTVMNRNCDKRKTEHVCVSHEACCSVDLAAVVETERFSSASSSTVFHSCSDIEEDGTSLQTQKDNNKLPQFSLDTFRASSICNIGGQSQQGKHHKICIEGGTFPITQCQNNKTLNHDVCGMEKRIRNCGVVAPKKITEDSLLSAALWSLLIQSAKGEKFSKELRENLGPNVSQILKSKRVLHKTKQLLFDCVREITITLPRKDQYGQRGNKKIMGAEELGKIICQRTKEWGQQGAAGDETNLTHLLTLDYLNSINEWSKFEQHVKDVSFEIADEILECVNNEIVSDMIQFLPPTNRIVVSL